jgi:signal transduction histidine kinase
MISEIIVTVIAVVEADKARINQVIMNFLSNAIKFCQ